MLTKLGYVTVADPPSSATFGELADVRLRHAIESEGVAIAPGACGTVLMVHGKGEAYTVEFDDPANMLVLVEADALEPLPDDA